MDQGCNLNHDCPGAGLHYQPPEKYNACTIPQQAPEPVDGCKFLPFPKKVLLFLPREWTANHYLFHKPQGSRLSLLAAPLSRHKRTNFIPLVVNKIFLAS